MAVKLPPDFPKDYLIDGINVIEDRKLGEGAYGIVKLANYHGLTVAVKKLLPSFFPHDVSVRQLDEEAQIILESFFNECSKLSRIRHPNVIQLLGITLDKETRLPAIIMELMHENLSHLLKRTSSLPLYCEVNITHDIARALAYLHEAFSPPIVHRDLSSNNILISKDYRAKVTDLGVSKFESSSFFQRMVNTPAPGTIVYMAPEVRHIPADCSPAMDIFALGVLVIQIRSHKFPSPGPEQEKGKLGFAKTVPEHERRHNHIKLMGRSHPLTKIALDCIKNSPKTRPTGLEICRELESISATNAYEESKLACQIQDGEAEAIRERISGLQHDLEQAKGELVQTKEEIERLTLELQNQQQDTYQLSESAMSGGASVSDNNSKKFSTKLKSALKRNKKKKKSKDVPMAEDDNEDENEDENNDMATSSEEGFALITPRIVSEAEREMNKQELKSSTFSWTSHRCLLEGLQGATLRAYVAGCSLYLCGGATATSQPNNSVYFCTSRNVTRSWAKIVNPTPQYYYASAIINRELVLIGGLNASDGKCSRQLVTLDSHEKTWMSVLPPLPSARYSAAATTWGEYLIVIGGINDNGKVLDTVELLHLPSHQWSKAVSLPFGLAGSSVVAHRSRLYVLGGATSDGLTKAFFSIGMDHLLATTGQFNRWTTSSADVWVRHEDSPYTMMSLCLYRGYLLALGGDEKTISINQPAEWIWCYFSDDGWTLIQHMHTGRKLCCAVSLSPSKLAVFGGNPYYSVVDVANIKLPPLAQ
jgi:serine/threonine protein kinase